VSCRDRGRPALHQLTQLCCLFSLDYRLAPRNRPPVTVGHRLAPGFPRGPGGKVRTAGLPATSDSTRTTSRQLVMIGLAIIGLAIIGLVIIGLVLVGLVLVGLALVGLVLVGLERRR
jgi:hypothetical protein